jgi:hypothetical protein
LPSKKLNIHRCWPDRSLRKKQKLGASARKRRRGLQLLAKHKEAAIRALQTAQQRISALS